MLTESLKSRMPASSFQLFGIRQIEEHNMDACVYTSEWRREGAWDGIQITCVVLASDQRKEELPTLLHFAARYGLKKLTTVLLQCPGALQAYSVMNKYGDYPNTLAEKSGFIDLRQFMDEYVVSAAMREVFRDCLFPSDVWLCSNKTGDCGHSQIPLSGGHQHWWGHRGLRVDVSRLWRHHDEVLGLLWGHIWVNVGDWPWMCRRLMWDSSNPIWSVCKLKKILAVFTSLFFPDEVMGAVNESSEEAILRKFFQGMHE